MRGLVLVLGLVLGCEQGTEPCYELPCPSLGCEGGTCAWEHKGPVVSADGLVEKPAERRAYELGASDDNIVALRGAAKSEVGVTGREGAAGAGLCGRYAVAAGRVVNGWYPSGFDGRSHGGLVGQSVNGGSSLTRGVPERTIGWSCGSEGLRLELELPERDARHERAEDALEDILSALPWRGLDAKADGMRIVVTLVKSGDVAAFEPAKG